MGECQHEPAVEIGKAQEAMNLSECCWGWPVTDDLDLGWIHMYAMLINDVPQVMDDVHVEGSFFQVGVYLLLSQGVQKLLNMLQVFGPSLVEIRMSSRYTTTKVLVNGRRISSIILMKVVGSFFKPNGMTNHSKRPSFDLKGVFHTFVYSIGTWW
jgi:hypothetical protein